ncbi:hypothetical protein BH23THE1_BH23THE1_18350 [soil metagenome]
MYLGTFAYIFAPFFVLWYVELELASGQDVNPHTSLFICDLYVGKFYTLNESLDCDFENGIAINTNNTVINLNNSSILGSGYLNPYTGILISNKENVTLTGNGIIGHFQIGVYINKSNTTLKSNHFTRSFGVDINMGNGGKFNEIDNSISNNTCPISIPETLDLLRN